MASHVVRFSASIENTSLQVLKRRARRLHGGNVSAVIAEFAEWAREREGREALLDWMGEPPPMTDRERAAIDVEMHGAPVPAAKRKKTGASLGSRSAAPRKRSRGHV
jgi:hypothetical protein